MAFFDLFASHLSRLGIVRSAADRGGAEHRQRYGSAQEADPGIPAEPRARVGSHGA